MQRPSLGSDRRCFSCRCSDYFTGPLAQDLGITARRLRLFHALGFDQGIFLRSIKKDERVSPSCVKRSERGLWQRHFGNISFGMKTISHAVWITFIRTGQAYKWVERATDWPHSSFHTFVRRDYAWSYPRAQAPYGAISDYFSFYPSRVECFVDSERVGPQPVYFYGGWITNEIVGPWKGGLETESW